MFDVLTMNLFDRLFFAGPVTDAVGEGLRSHSQEGQSQLRLAIALSASHVLPQSGSAL